MEQFKIFGFAGSLRKDSYNKYLLRTAEVLLPENTGLEIYDLEGIPPFNQDLESQPPAEVKEFKIKIKAADALLIATPEYNYSMPGVLKNAIDWGSRPYGDNSFNDKAVGIMGVSIGTLGTARAQYHLRQSCVFMNMHPLNKPEVMVGAAQSKFDNSGNLIDTNTKDILKNMLAELVVWAKRLKQRQ